MVSGVQEENMKAKEEREKLMEDLRNSLNCGDGGSLTYFQKRPYTMVKVVLLFNQENQYHVKLLSGLGFTKVNYPDTWNPKYGLELATTKALKHIVKQILK